mmetsp:Transcript_12910/g.24245  ORF Transcript_12910/g.24245 Transcript_12910/m.24245 type:complete len:210 (+) Transcript_12910:161-790(+)
MRHNANAFSFHPLVVSNMALLGELPEQQDHRKNNHNHNGKNDNNNSLINAHKLSQCLDRMEQSYWMRFHETNTSSDDYGQRLLELYDSQTRSNSTRRRIILTDNTNSAAAAAPFGRNEISHPSFQNDSPHAQNQQQQEQLQNLIVVQDHQGSLQTTTTTNRISSSCGNSSVIFESKNPAGPEEEPNDKDDEDAPLDDLEQWLDNVIDLK